MAGPADNVSMALFCDFENVALGVRDAKYDRFDIKPILERLLTKGSIVVKKAYCDWDRYKGFKAAMHEANFELIEIPHVRQSGKNSADIRLVVDALDLCYTKSHVDTFVIISGDSDFSPLVSKLRENAKQVIGVGVKQSTSDLLIANCDEFIYYDDLVRDGQRNAQRRNPQERSPRRTPEEEAKRREEMDARKNKAIEMVVSTFEDLIAVRGDNDRIWASVLKEVVKRRNPGFNESYFGFRVFGNLLEEAAARGLLGFGRDDKGAYVTRATARPVQAESANEGETSESVSASESINTPEFSAEVLPAAEEVQTAPGETEPRRSRSRAKTPRGEGRRSSTRKPKAADAPVLLPENQDVVPAQEEVVVEAAAVDSKPRRRTRSPQSKAKSTAKNELTVAEVMGEQAVVSVPLPETAPEAASDVTKPARRPRGGRKPGASRKSAAST